MQLPQRDAAAQHAPGQRRDAVFGQPQLLQAAAVLQALDGGQALIEQPQRAQRGEGAQAAHAGVAGVLEHLQHGRGAAAGATAALLLLVVEAVGGEQLAHGGGGLCMRSSVRVQQHTHRCVVGQQLAVRACGRAEEDGDGVGSLNSTHQLLHHLQALRPP